MEIDNPWIRHEKPRLREMLVNLNSDAGAESEFRRQTCFCGVSVFSLWKPALLSTNREGTYYCRIFNFENKKVNYFVPDGLQYNIGSSGSYS